MKDALCDKYFAEYTESRFLRLAHMDGAVMHIAKMTLRAFDRAYRGRVDKLSGVILQSTQEVLLWLATNTCTNWPCYLEEYTHISLRHWLTIFP